MKLDYKELLTGEIDILYEGEGFWDGKDESMDEYMDLEYCYQRFTREAIMKDLDMEGLYDTQAVAWDILEDEYNFAVKRYEEVR